MLDGKAFGTEIVGIVRDFVARSVEPLAKKLDELQLKVEKSPLHAEYEIIAKRLSGLAEEIAELQSGKDAAPIDLDALRSDLEVAISRSVACIPVPKDGASVTPADLAPLVSEYVAKAVAEIPKQKDGRSAYELWVSAEKFRTGKEHGIYTEQEWIESLRGKEGLPGRDGINGKDGTSITADDILPLIRDTVALIPKPKDGEPGKDVDPEAIRALVATEVAKAIAAIPAAKDGLEGKDGVKGIDGRDGRDGLPGVPGTPGEKGLDGINGKNGVDGFGLEDFEMSLADDGRTFTAKFARGEVNKTFTFVIPTVLDRGIYRVENEYTKGDGATWDGSWWIAQTETKDKPGTSGAWRLAAKRGRDGKDGKDGKEGIRGKDGADARGLTREQAMAIMNSPR